MRLPSFAAALILFSAAHANAHLTFDEMNAELDPAISCDKTVREDADESQKLLSRELQFYRAYWLQSERRAGKRSVISGSDDQSEYAQENEKRVSWRSTACGLTTAESWAIYAYSGEYFYDLNKALRDPHRAKLPETMAYTEVLNRALAKLEKYRGEVYRTVNLPEAVFSQHQVGAIVTYPAYTSTSKIRASGFKHQLVIQSKTGRYIAGLSSRKTENEVLLKEGSRFLVLAVEPRADGTVVINLEEVAE